MRLEDFLKLFEGMSPGADVVMWAGDESYEPCKAAEGKITDADGNIVENTIVITTARVSDEDD